MNIFMNVREKIRYLFFFLFSFFFVVQVLFSDEIRIDDFEASRQYVIWIRQAIEEERWSDVMRALERARDFSDVNSDISYLYALMFSRWGSNRENLIAILDEAIEVNRWEYYGENDALILKAEKLVYMRRYHSALVALEQIRESDLEAAVLRLKAFRGIAVNTQGDTELAAFRSLTLSVMNGFSRDTRSAKIFLEFLRGREVAASDRQIIDLIIRRLPILAEIDPCLAWMTAPYMNNLQDAQRYVAAYRAGGLSGKNARDFKPHPGSIPLALHYGLIDEKTAVEELFSGSRGSNNPLSSSDMGIFAEIDLDGNPVIDFNILNDVYEKLRHEEGRELFTDALYSLDGYIVTDIENDGIIENRVLFKNGAVRRMILDRSQNNRFDMIIEFDSNGIPSESTVLGPGYNAKMIISWERYPFVEAIYSQDDAEKYEYYYFRPADFNYTPVSFITLGGSRNRTGISFPVLSNRSDLNRRSLILSCATVRRESIEFDGAEEFITLENGIPIQAVEQTGNKVISVTEFENGFPVVSYVDLDLDGRMETIRRYNRPGNDIQWPEPDEKFNYRKLLASQENNRTGTGRYKTKEVYLNDGSIVFELDIDGTGETKRYE